MELYLHSPTYLRTTHGEIRATSPIFLSTNFATHLFAVCVLLKADYFLHNILTLHDMLYCTPNTVYPTLAFFIPNYCITAICFGPLSRPSSGSSQNYHKITCTYNATNTATDQRTVESQSCTRLENAVQVDFHNMKPGS